MDAVGFVILAGITIGTHVLKDNAANLPPPPPVCKMETVKAENGNYNYQVLSQDNPSNCQ